MFIANIRKTSNVVSWIKATLNILKKEWPKIDTWRINKFLSLVREVFVNILNFMKKKKWKIKVITLVNAPIVDELFIDN